MGLWGWIKQIFGNEPRRPRERIRGPNKTAAERLALQRLRNMNWLKRNDPDAYRQAILRETGVIRDATNPINQLKELAELQRTARKLGLGGESGGGDSIDKLIEAAPQLMTALGPIIMRGMSGNQPAPVADPLQIEVPKPKRKSRIADAEMVDLDAPEPDEPEESESNMVITPELAAQFARSNMEGKSAREAARFLLSQEGHPAVKGMIDVITRTTDSKLIVTLHEHAASTGQPALIGLMAWFESQPAWTLEIAKYVRTAKRLPASRGKLRAL